MTNPVFLAEEVPDGPSSWTLTGEEARHAHVMRLAPGDGIDVVDGRGTRARGTVATATPTAVEIDVLTVTHEGDDAEVVLVQALAKGGRDEDAIEMATEVGVDVVVPWQADRSIAQWPAARAGRAATRWETRLRAATKQSRRSRIPGLFPLHDSRALARLVAETGAAGGTTLVLDESASLPLHRVELPARGRVVVIVGPEGGVSPRELEAFTAAGATPVVAGPHVMRSGTAGPVAVSHVARAVGRWDTPGTIGATAPERPA